MEIQIIKKPITKFALKQFLNENFIDLVKAAVDVEQEIIALGGELHIDELELLVEKENSKPQNVWGINLYPQNYDADFIEFDSMINLKPDFWQFAPAALMTRQFKKDS